MHMHTHQCFCCNKPLQITNHSSYMLLSCYWTNIYIRHTHRVKYNKFETWFQQLHYKLTFRLVHSVSNVRLSGRLACHPSPVVQCCRRRSVDSPLLADLHVLRKDVVPVQFMIHQFQRCFTLFMKPNRRVKTYNFYPTKSFCIFEWAYLRNFWVYLHGLYEMIRCFVVGLVGSVDLGSIRFLKIIGSSAEVCV